MSYWVYLHGEDLLEALEVPAHSEGGTFVAYGTSRAEINITYNYSKWYTQELDAKLGLGWINGKKAKDCIERLEKAIKALGTVEDPDYWNSTAGNAGHALDVLLGWAKLHPDGVFGVN